MGFHSPEQLPAAAGARDTPFKIKGVGEPALAETAEPDETETSATNAISDTDVPSQDTESSEPTPVPSEATRAKSRKGRRASVPRWDEILFGAGQSDA
jgi:hypothetical protein